LQAQASTLKKTTLDGKMIQNETIRLARLIIGEKVAPSESNRLNETFAQNPEAEIPPAHDSDSLGFLDTYLLLNFEDLSQASFASLLTKYLLTSTDHANLEASNLAVNWIHQQLAIQSRTEVVLSTLAALSSTNLPMFADSAARLDNLTDLATYIHDESGSIPLFRDRQSEIVSSVSAQSESLTAAKLAVDAATQSWHFSFYMIADNNLEAAAIDDLFELRSLSQSEHVSVSVALDRSPLYDRRLGDW